MALDPSIILGIKPVDIQDPLKQYSNALSVQSQRQQAQRNALTAQREDDAYQRDTDKRNALRDYYRNGRTKDGLAALAAVSPDAYADEYKAQLEEEGKRAAIAKDNAESAAKDAATRIQGLTMFAQALQGVRDQAGYERARDIIAPFVSPEQLAKFPPQYDPQMVQQMMASSVKIIDAQNAALRGREVATGERNAATAADRLAWDQAHPASTVVQTADGPMFVDPRNRTSAPVMGANGQPVGAQLQKPPSSIVTAHAENNAVLGNIDDAIAGLDSPGGKNATGIGKGIGYRVPLVGEQLVNWKDPAGMENRALIANIGSKVIHDRSGAAVTISEMPRLAPFIPAIGDKPEQVRKKLELLRQNIAAMQGEFEGTYSGLRPYTRGTPASIRGDGDPVRNRANSYYGSGNANSQ